MPLRAPFPKMKAVARRLIAEEYAASDVDGWAAAFRVCSKLQKSLSALTGAKGFGSLFTRALSRAGEEAPWLNAWVVDASGALVAPGPDVAVKINSREAAKGGLALVVHLLELLATFIGEALTLRLVQQVWPKATLQTEHSKRKS